LGISLSENQSLKPPALFSSKKEVYLPFSRRGVVEVCDIFLVLLLPTCSISKFSVPPSGEKRDSPRLLFPRVSDISPPPLFPRHRQVALLSRKSPLPGPLQEGGAIPFLRPQGAGPAPFFFPPPGHKDAFFFFSDHSNDFAQAVTRSSFSSNRKGFSFGRGCWGPSPLFLRTGNGPYAVFVFFPPPPSKKDPSFLFPPRWGTVGAPFFLVYRGALFFPSFFLTVSTPAAIASAISPPSHHPRASESIPPFPFFFLFPPARQGQPRAVTPFGFFLFWAPGRQPLSLSPGY